MPLDALDDAAVRRWAFRARDALAQHRHRIDALNVYPVPDGDTGTNLYLTLHAGLEGLVGSFLARDRGSLALSEGVRALARSTLFAARGNSGVILSQLVRGLADVVSQESGVDERGIDGPVYARILQQASDYARAAVTDPVEGTILTVARAAAQAALDVCTRDTSLCSVVRASVDAARDALVATTGQLEDLRRAGVVDAGGAGFLLILQSLLQVVMHDPTPLDTTSLGAEPDAGGASDDRHDPSFEVMYLVDGCAEDGAENLRARLVSIGDSVLVAGDEQVRSVHVHTDEAGEAVEAGLDAGRVYGIRVTCLHTHAPHDSLELLEEPAPEPDLPPVDFSASTPEEERQQLGVVATVQGAGLAQLCARAGAVVVHDAPGRRVTPQMFIDAMHATRADVVVLLPNDPDALLSAEVAAGVARAEGLDPRVVPTRYSLQGLAALAVYDPTDPAAADLMTETALAMRCGTVVTATAAANTEAGPCRPGDILGFVDGAVVIVGADLAEVGRHVTSRLLTEDCEVVTLVEGAHAAGLAARVAARLERELSGTELTTFAGGQPIYDLLVGVE